MLHFLFDRVPAPPCAEPLPQADPIFAFVCFMTVYLIFLGLILLYLPDCVARPIMRIAFGERKTEQ